MGLAFIEKLSARVIMIPEEDLENVEDLDVNVSYNLDLLFQRGLVKVEKISNYTYVNLSAAGHDAVDAIRDDTFWNKLKDVTPKEGADLIKSTLTTTVGAAVIQMLGYN